MQIEQLKKRCARKSSSNDFGIGPEGEDNAYRNRDTIIFEQTTVAERIINLVGQKPNGGKMSSQRRTDAPLRKAGTIVESCKEQKICNYNTTKVQEIDRPRSHIWGREGH